MNKVASIKNLILDKFLSSTGGIVVFENKLFSLFTDSAHLANSQMPVHEKIKFLLEDVKNVPGLLAKVSEKYSERSPIEVIEMPYANQASRRLKSLFDKHGSDKSRNHGYDRIYAQILEGISVLRVLEIGIGSVNDLIPSNMGQTGTPGASLRAWEEALPGAEIYGADIDSEILFDAGRISCHHVDQLNTSSLGSLRYKLGTVGEFQLIIDDGLHSPEANLRTFLGLSDLLAHGGVYIIEDISPDAVEIFKLLAMNISEVFSTKIYRASSTLVFAAFRL